jgi:cyclophilin family peptidyl-prolyl cis-trans isomerase
MHAFRSRIVFSSFALWLAAIAAVTAACGRSSPPPTRGTIEIKSSGGKHVAMETSLGTIEFELLQQDAPVTVENFRLLAEKGYYNGVIFHRIVKGFMIQGGDPKGTGEGGESAWGGEFADEIDPRSPLYKAGYKRGLLAMANSGPNTNGSQFFIMHQDYPLPPSYTIFGRVTKGLEVVDAMAALPTTYGDDGNRSKPLKPPAIKKITVLP